MSASVIKYLTSSDFRDDLYVTICGFAFGYIAFVVILGY